MRHRQVIALLAALVIAGPLSLISTRAQSGQSPYAALHFRDIGPAVTSGRIDDIAIDPKDPSTLWVGSAGGGIWKTTSHGLMWKDVFGAEPDNSFGALAIFANDSRIVWAGSGEQNNRQSSTWGGGVYRTTDGGDTWTYLGLHNTRAIARVVLDPVSPNVAYVAAVGNLWAANPERGVFKTVDAGRSWQKVLFVDDVTGATDLVMDPRDSKVLYAATYQRMRSACCFDGGGPGSAIWKSSDAGATWDKLEQGLPAGDKGRIGLAIAMSKPDVLVATIEHATASGTYRTEDAGASWKLMGRTNPRPMYYSEPTIDPNNDRHVWLPGTSIVHSMDGGATFIEEPTSPTYDLGLKTDHHILRVDPADSNHIYVVGDGGLHESFDMGKTYVRNGAIPVSQAYKVAVDNRDPYWVYTGLQDNHSWMGPSATRHWLGILNSDWLEVGFSDGTGKAVDVADWRKVYTSSSGGNLSLVDPVTGDTQAITPHPAPGEPPYRFDWNAPVIASTHTPGTVYLGGNKLFISKDYGATWAPTIDLTRSINRDNVVMMGVVNRDVKLSRNDGDNISEIASIAESPLDAKVLWVGTDDGNVQLSTDGGAHWTNVAPAIVATGKVKDGTFVGSILASGAGRGGAFVAFDAHRDGDFKPYLFRTSDFGKSWQAVSTGLPTDDASIRSVAEFPGKPAVVFVGTERALFVSHDSGDHWMRLAANLPTTQYADIVVQPRTKDLVLATHGRGIWILDNAAPVAEWSASVAAEPVHLFDVPRATLMLYWEDTSNMGQAFYTSDNPAEGAVFTYSLGHPAKSVKFVVTNEAGRTVRELPGPTDAGVIQRVNWDLRFTAPAGGGRGTGGGGEEGGGGASAVRAGAVQLPIPSHDIRVRGPFVAPGTFKVTVEVDGMAAGSKTFVVRPDPQSTVTLAQHKEREAYVLDVQDLQARVDAIAKDVAAKRAAANGAAHPELDAIETQLGAAGGGGRRGGGAAGSGQKPSIRQRLGGLLTGLTISGATTGSLAPPTAEQRQTLAALKTEVATLERNVRNGPLR